MPRTVGLIKRTNISKSFQYAFTSYSLFLTVIHLRFLAPLVHFACPSISPNLININLFFKLKDLLFLRDISLLHARRENFGRNYINEHCLSQEPRCFRCFTQGNCVCCTYSNDLKTSMRWTWLMTQDSDYWFKWHLRNY